MALFLRIDINLMAIILLGTVSYISSKRLDRTDYLNRAYLVTSLVVLIEITMETATCVINKSPFLYLIPLSILLHFFLFSFAPILTYLWYLFIRRLIDPYQTIKTAKKFLLGIPVLFNLVLTMLSPFYHFVYYIDSSNTYHRGNLFYIFVFATYIYTLYAFLFLLSRFSTINAKEILPFLALSLIPILGGILQTFYYGILLMWSSVAYSLVIMYVFLQQRMVHLDYLTGAWDRGSFDHYISERLMKNTHLKIGLIYMDIDNLKKINDTYGHTEGDFAIKKSIELIKNTIRHDDIIVRMGGDEFIIVINSESPEIIQKIIIKLELTITSYNKLSDRGYPLSYSLGGSIFDSDKGSIEQFLNHIDNLMYENKKSKK